LVGAVLLAVVVVAVALTVRHYVGIARSNRETTESKGEGLIARLRGLGQIISKDESKDGGSAVMSVAKTAGAQEELTGIEGLVLRLSRPTNLANVRVEGLAVGNDSVHVAWYDANAKFAQVSRLDSDRLTVALSRKIDSDGRYVVGGLCHGPSGLWTSVSEEGAVGGTMIIGLDPQSLSIRNQFLVAQRISSVAEIYKGRLLGLAETGAQVIEWDTSGAEQQRHDLASGVRYSDLDVVEGMLVAFGQDAESGVIDIVDPTNLALVARHRCYARGKDGAYLTAAAGDTHSERVYLVGLGGSYPMIQEFDVRDGDWAGYIPRPCG